MNVTTRFALHPARPSKVLFGAARPALDCGHVVEVDGERRLLAAENAALASVRVPDDMPLGPLSREALIALERGSAQIDEHCVTVDHGGGHHEVYERPTAPHIQAGAEVLTGMEARFRIPPGEESAAVWIDPRLLLQLAKAIGTGKGYGVKLRIAADPTAAIIVENALGNRGLLMPMRLAVEGRGA